MYEEAEKWMKAVGKRKFMGGSAPNLADLVKDLVLITVTLDAVCRLIICPHPSFVSLSQYLQSTFCFVLFRQCMAY